MDKLRIQVYTDAEANSSGQNAWRNCQAKSEHLTAVNSSVLLIILIWTKVENNGDIQCALSASFADREAVCLSEIKSKTKQLQRKN